MSRLQSSDPKAQAKALLGHYMQTVWEKAGLQWNIDNITEVEAIVDEIIDATLDVVHDIIHDALANHRIDCHLHPDG